MKHKVFCIIGRTASGKSSIVNAVANKMNLRVLKSYTTRARRSNEDDEHCDHTFITNNDLDEHIGKMVAYTERHNYCSFATIDQLLTSDFYIINPTGFIELKKKVKEFELEDKVELVEIWITCNRDKLKDRGRLRDNYDEWYSNYLKENEEFTKFYEDMDYTYVIDNTNSLNESIETMENIVTCERNNHKYTEKKFRW